MTPEAMEAIQELYGELRQEAAHLSLPITVRSLETIIRLSTAAAKARMSEEGVEQVSLLSRPVQIACTCCEAASLKNKKGALCTSVSSQEM